MTGSASASADQSATLKEVMNGSVGLSVTGSRPSSGSESQPMIVCRKMKVKTSSTTIALSEMITRVRSSVRCSTSDASSS